MTFNDIFKTDFFARINSFSMVDAVIALVLAFVVGLFIFAIYRKTYLGIMYNAGFGISLIALAMITSFVILAVTSNVVLSLGMVGALSIVRFRTAIKEPMDIVFLFWSIAAGIVLGAGLIPLAVIGSLFIGITIIAFSKIKYHDVPYILVINCEKDSGSNIEERLNKKTQKHILKSSAKNNKGINELTYEVRITKNDPEFLNSILDIDGVSNAVLVSYNGEYMQ